jgi:hypothetical protein
MRFFDDPRPSAVSCPWPENGLVRRRAIRDAFSSSQRHSEVGGICLDDRVVAAQVVATLDHPGNGGGPECGGDGRAWLKKRPPPCGGGWARGVVDRVSSRCRRSTRLISADKVRSASAASRSSSSLSRVVIWADTIAGCSAVGAITKAYTAYATA